MISTGDTAFVLTQAHIAHSIGVRSSAPPLGTTVPARPSPLVAVHPTLASASAYAHGLKG
jgi:hypothetical protein